LEKRRLCHEWDIGEHNEQDELEYKALYWLSIEFDDESKSITLCLNNRKEILIIYWMDLSDYH